MTTLTGTGRLVRLALRRDRLALPVWVVAIASIIGLNMVAVIDIYASTHEKRESYAVTSASSIVARVTGGPLDGPSVGAIVLNEVFVAFGLAVAFMSIHTVVRHTRQNEETGRAELLGSAVVGRYASLVAALTVAALANLLIGVLIVVLLLLNGLPLVGAVGTAAAVGAVGLTFAAIAALASQVGESARGANSLSIACLGVAFGLRAVGDGVGQLSEHGMAVVSAWPSWLSPFGWGQQVHPFTQGNWWVFGLFLMLIVGLVGLSFVVAAHRDFGQGLFPVRRGPATASRHLLSPLGLAWRLQAGLLRGWVIAVAGLGVTFGVMAKEFQKLLTENQQLEDVLAHLGGTGSITDVFFGAMMVISGMVIAGYALQALLRMHAEEAEGRLEAVLATSVSRPVWLLSHLACVLGGVVVLSVTLGLSTGLSFVLVADQPWTTLGSLLGAALAQAPAVFVMVGFVVAVFGFLPRQAAAAAWAGLAASLILGQFGSLLQLPTWVINLSPFAHSPAAPAETIAVGPVLLMLVIAMGLGVGGLYWFRQRNYAF